MTVNIVREDVVKHEMNRFVKAELSYPGTQVLSSQIQDDTVRVVAVGREIADGAVAEARDRMQFYGLGGMELVVIQASNEESFALATSQINSAEQANTLLSSQVADLQRQLAAINAYDTLSVHVTAEAHTLFSEVKSVAVGHLGGKTVALVESNGWNAESGVRERLEAWLRTRVKDKEVDIIIR
jgi:hypothetical protein